MSDVTHPRCGKRWSNNNSVGHCSGCCETFVGLKAFDMHRKAGACKALTDGQERWWLDPLGQWRYGPPMSAEERVRLFGANA